MKPNITQTACQSEVLCMPEENNSLLEVKTATRLEFDPDQVLNRYWELARLGPDETKGNILGQLKALDALREEQTSALTSKPTKQFRLNGIYRAAWMAES
jgi:hypothetical protein